MLRELLGLLPDAMARWPMAGACAGVAAGLILWLVGARFSRSILALLAVSIGALIGMKLPEWRGWTIDGMGLAVAGAIVLGAAAFLFHRTLIGLLLGAFLMLWAALGAWLGVAGHVSWDWHPIRWNGDLVQLLRDTWQTLPPEVARPVPIAAVLGLGIGIALAVAFGKLSKVMTYALAGVTLMTLMGALALSDWGPQSLARLPGSSAAQGAALVGLVLLGMLWQWQITPPKGGAGNVAPRKS